MAGLELAVALGVAILLCTTAARRLHLPPPALLLVVGLLLGFLPALREVHLPPEAVLLLFLPVLLYWESFTASFREIRSNLRVIVLLSTTLVAVTAALVAATAHALGLPWAPAWVLGGALAPTDATAVGVLGGSLPRRIAGTLRAESLVNDGTALVIYGLAVTVTVGSEQFSLGRLAELFAVSYVGGIVAGLAVTWVAVQVRRRLTDPGQHVLLALVAPLTAYLLAETVHASGVLAVVVSGLWVSRVSPRLFPAAARQQVQTVMGFATSTLNSALFVLIGIEVHGAARDLASVGSAQALLAAAAVSAAVAGARFAWLFTSPYLIRLVDRRPEQRRRRVGARTRAVMAFAGFRGAVSLAAALAVPLTLTSGAPFPDRDLIVFVTACVITVTLVVQAPLLPAVVRWARLRSDEETVEQERRRAEILATEGALEALPRLVEDLGAGRAAAERLREEYDRHLRVLQADQRDTDDAEDTGDAVEVEERYADLRLALIGHKHATVVGLRDRNEIDDLVLQDIQARLDLEEVEVARRRAR